MACRFLYSFADGARIQLPTILRAAAVDSDAGHHGVRAILNPDEVARALIGDHIRVLSELRRAAQSA